MNNPDSLAVADGLARKVSMGIAADDPTTRQFTGLVVRYKGSSASCLLTTVANTHISSAIGASGAEAADANFTYPAGGTSGVISFDALGFLNVGQAVDFINNLDDYEARLVALRRADGASTTGALKAVASQQAKTKDGYAFAIDTSVADHISCEVSVMDGKLWKSESVDPDYKRASRNEIHYVDGMLGYAGADIFEIIEVDDEAKTDEVVYTSTISAVLAASGTAGSEDFSRSSGIGITGRTGKRLIARARAATSVSTAGMASTGYFNLTGVIKALT